MTDAELIARLRLHEELIINRDGYSSYHSVESCLAAADRIEALEAKLKTSEEIGKAFEEDAGQLRAKLAKCEARLGKAVEALDRLVALNDDYSPFGGELLQDRVERTWQKARATLAEIKSHSDEFATQKGEGHE